MSFNEFGKEEGKELIRNKKEAPSFDDEHVKQKNENLLEIPILKNVK